MALREIVRASGNASVPVSIYEATCQVNSTTDALVYNSNGNPYALQPSEVKQCTATISATSGGTGTTLTDVTGLTGFNMVASGVYAFDVDLQTVCTTNSGISIAFKYTTMTASAIQVAAYTGAAASMAEARSTTTTDQTKFVDNKTAAWLHVRLTGTLTVGTAGTLSVQFAQNTSHADTTSVFIGSVVKFTRIA